MSRDCRVLRIDHCSSRERFANKLINLPSEIAFETTNNLAFGQTLCYAASQISLGWFMPAPDFSQDYQKLRAKTAKMYIGSNLSAILSNAPDIYILYPRTVHFWTG